MMVTNTLVSGWNDAYIEILICYFYLLNYNCQFWNDIFFNMEDNGSVVATRGTATSSSLRLVSSLGLECRRLVPVTFCHHILLPPLSLSQQISVLND